METIHNIRDEMKEVKKSRKRFAERLSQQKDNPSKETCQTRHKWKFSLFIKMCWQKINKKKKQEKKVKAECMVAI